MPTQKVDPKAAVKNAKKAAEAGKKTADHLSKTASGIFNKIKEHTPDKKQVDEFQKKWLAMPENRKKYKKLSDAPQVAAEEVLGIANDIIDFIQREPTGESKVFGKLKESLSKIKKDPKKFLADKAAIAKSLASKGMDVAKKGTEVAKKGKDIAKKGAKTVKKNTK